MQSLTLPVIRPALPFSAVLGLTGMLVLTGCSGLNTPTAPEANAVATPAAVAAPMATQAKARGGWTDNFDQLDTNRWGASDWQGFWQRDGLSGAFTPNNAKVDGKGHLVLKLDVQSCGAQLCAQAAELATHNRYGFGRYTVRMRMASTSADASVPGQARPGNISAAFGYYNDSATEIDIELEGMRSKQVNTTVWKGTAAKSTALVDTPSGSDVAANFHTYTYDWRPDRITYYIDGVQVWSTTQNVPQESASFLLNVWPTVDSGWGGVAQPGTVYMLVDSVSFQPA